MDGNALRRLVPIFLMKRIGRHIAGLVAAATMAAGAAEPSPHAIDIPKWFSESFLDFREEAREAAAAGKRVMVYFGQDGCPYCKALMEVNFGQEDIAEATRKRFVAIALNLWGDRETVWTDGVARTEKALGTHLRVQFTPTLVFLDEQGREALRLNGYLPPARFRAALAYAATAKAGGPPFSEHERREGVARARPAVPVPGAFRSPPASLAGTGGRPAMLVFESRECDACAELHEAFHQGAARELLGRFDAVRLDAFGKAEVVAPDGTRVPEAGYARSLAVKLTPTLVFLEGGREVFRAEGYLRPFHLASVLDYVASGAHRTEPNFQRFVQARAERERAAGRSVDLW